MAAPLLREDCVKADNEPRWQSASDLLLVVAVAAVAFGLAAVGVGLAELSSTAPSPLVTPGGSPLLEAEGFCRSSSPLLAACDRDLSDGGHDGARGVDAVKVAAVRFAPASDVAAPVMRSISPVGASAMAPADNDPRAFLAHMTAVMHRRGLPLPASEGRMQSLINQSAGQGDDAPSVP